jgi:D-sedoheptulose 7-phosphate isomerase
MHAVEYLIETAKIAEELDHDEIERLAYELSSLREKNGRLVCVGLGGGAANASHAANDFRKLCHIRAYCPTDSVSEFTARWNDEGKEFPFVDWARLEKLGFDDAVFVFSVGGGSSNVSQAIAYISTASDEMGFKLFGILGPHGGVTKKYADRVILVPAPKERLTPHTEAFQSVVTHCLASHPLLQRQATKW